MVTYIRNIIPGYYIEFDEEIDQEYWAGKIGYNYQDFLDGKWVLLSDEQVAFHNEHPEASIEEVLNTELHKKTLEEAKEEKIKQIEDYDRSDNVNSFTINGYQMWLTVEERQQLSTQVTANKAIGRETMTKWYGGNEFTYPIVKWEQMLVALEVYAGDALNVTESHKATVNAMTSIEDVDNFDITQGYPDKLIFD